MISCRKILVADRRDFNFIKFQVDDRIEHTRLEQRREFHRLTVFHWFYIEFHGTTLQQFSIIPRKFHENAFRSAIAGRLLNLLAEQNTISDTKIKLQFSRYEMAPLSSPLKKFHIFPLLIWISNFHPFFFLLLWLSLHSALTLNGIGRFYSLGSSLFGCQ